MVKEVENKVYEKWVKVECKDDLDEEEIVGDFFFNLVYIGILVIWDLKELVVVINYELGDGNDIELVVIMVFIIFIICFVGKYYYVRFKSLKLGRSNDYKIIFEFNGVNVDLVIFLFDFGEIVSFIDVCVCDLVVFDYVVIFMWKKFVIYDEDVGDREEGVNMVYIEFFNIKFVFFMLVFEIVLKVSILFFCFYVD